MKARLAGNGLDVPVPPEIHLLLAIIERARRDAVYSPRVGAKSRSVSVEEQLDAQSFLRELQSVSAASRTPVRE